MKLNITQWGNSAALRLPATLLAQLGVKVGDAFEADVSKDKLVLRVAKTDMPAGDATLAAMRFAVESVEEDEGMAFLRCFLRGDVDAIRNSWPDAPDVVFAGAKAGGVGWHENIRGPEYFKKP